MLTPVRTHQSGCSQEERCQHQNSTSKYDAVVIAVLKQFEVTYNVHATFKGQQMAINIQQRVNTNHPFALNINLFSRWYVKMKVKNYANLYSETVIDNLGREEEFVLFDSNILFYSYNTSMTRKHNANTNKL